MIPLSYDCIVTFCHLRFEWYFLTLMRKYYIQSYFSALTHVWPENCVVLLKSSLKFMPGFNVCAYLCEAIFVNRFSKVAAHKSVEQAINAVRNYVSLWVISHFFLFITTFQEMS